MSDYTIRSLAEVPDVFGGRYPGAMRFLADHLEARQVAFTHRLMPAGSGGRGGYGHRHRTQEEIYFVVSGALQFKLDDDVVDLAAGTAIRVGPPVARSIWNDGPDEAELVICSLRLEDAGADGELIEDFWPVDAPQAASSAGAGHDAEKAPALRRPAPAATPPIGSD